MLLKYYGGAAGCLRQPFARQATAGRRRRRRATRKNIFAKSLAAVQSWEPLEYGGVRLELADPHYDGPEDYSLTDQKKAILERGTLGRRLRGTWKLTDTATGQLLDQKKTTLANIPYMTARGTLLDNGLDYSIINQSRLRPGVFFREKASGELESHVNVKPGQGPSHRYFLDPEKGVFYAKFAQAKIPLMPLLHAMGVTHRDLEHTWGAEIAAANAAEDNPALLRKYHERLLRGPERQLPENEQTQLVIQRLAGMELDPIVTRHTMSQPHTGINKDSLLDISNKLLALSRGRLTASVLLKSPWAFQFFKSMQYNGLRKKLFVNVRATR